ncbi:MAG: hypothetical protein D3916_07175 [Candidatus Electrothrix sp. MAN1_4]|nr:hypothetical protein [Candidatus Electrothrix sp. MAN1_4]
MSNLSRSIADALEEHLDRLRCAKAQEEISKLEAELDATFQDSPEKEENMEIQEEKEVLALDSEKLKRTYFYLQEATKRTGIPEEDLLHYAETKQIQLHVVGKDSAGKKVIWHEYEKGNYQCEESPANFYPDALHPVDRYDILRIRSGVPIKELATMADTTHSDNSSESTCFEFNEPFLYKLSDLVILVEEMKKVCNFTEPSVEKGKSDLTSIFATANQGLTLPLEEKVSGLSLVEILELITPEMYPDGLKGQEKSAITKSVNTLKEQLPGAFELCSVLVMEAMPGESRKEPLTYSRDDIITRAKEKGINRPTALQIYQGLPAMLKK